jgi:hypothetical protein
MRQHFCPVVTGAFFPGSKATSARSWPHSAWRFRIRGFSPPSPNTSFLNTRTAVVIGFSLFTPLVIIWVASVSVVPGVFTLEWKMTGAWSWPLTSVCWQHLECPYTLVHLYGVIWLRETCLYRNKGFLPPINLSLCFGFVLSFFLSTKCTDELNAERRCPFSCLIAESIESISMKFDKKLAALEGRERILFWSIWLIGTLQI